MVISAIDLCTNYPKASESEVRAQLEGNICRCTGYKNILDAIEYARDHANSEVSA
jgi:carbon-monoxide dehydrogenase small subunit